MAAHHFLFVVGGMDKCKRKTFKKSDRSGCLKSVPINKSVAANVVVLSFCTLRIPFLCDAGLWQHSEIWTGSFLNQSCAKKENEVCTDVHRKLCWSPRIHEIPEDREDPL